MSLPFYHITIIGGGAAGFFAALRAAELNPGKTVCILEKTQHLLAKVKISGGGRCNVTHACYEQKELVGFYPRGEKELLGPFHQFMTFDTIAWFAGRGVNLKTEDDGRMFPETDESQTIIDCFMREAQQKNVKIITGKGVKDFSVEGNHFHLHTDDAHTFVTEKLVFCTGSSNRVWDMLNNKGIQMVKPVPSLFTFNYKNKAMNALMGLSVPLAQVNINGSDYEAQGPLLFTHWGFSGPAVLRLSAWAAPFLASKNYDFHISINFTGKEMEEVMEDIEQMRETSASRNCLNVHLTYIPRRLWELLVETTGISGKKLADLSKNDMKNLVNNLCAYPAHITGKSTFKDEFVTCGGVDLKEINMKTMESKKIKNLFFAGECINVDAITGGFNFQAAWTTGYIAGSNV